MSNSFVGSPCRAFQQSPCRARVSSGGKFIFQFLYCDVFAHNTDGTPWGWSGHPGQQVDAVWPDPMGAQFYSPVPVPGKGATVEYWGAEIDPFPLPNNPHLARGGFPYNNIIPNPAFLNPAKKAPGFGWVIGGHTYTILVAARRLQTYKPFHGIDGVDYPGGDWDKMAFRMKLFSPVSGIATYHTLTDSVDMPLNSGGFFAPVSIPLYKRTASRDAGDPTSEFFPDAPVTTALDIGHFPRDDTFGTVEVVLFWLERTLADLPPFPFLLDPSTL